MKMAASGSTPLRMLVPNAPWTAALADGSLDEPGLRWEAHLDTMLAPERFALAGTAGFDVGENGVSRAALDVLAGKPPSGLPVFYGREHMQRNLFVREDSPIQSLGDLEGRRIGSH